MSGLDMKELDFFKEFLSYDNNTGLFTWLVTVNNNKASKGVVAGHRHKKGRVDYVFIGLKGKMYRAHRLAWLYSYGEWPKGQIDHINGDPTDNRICNLRVVDNSENGKNRGKYITNKSGVVGVHWSSKNKKWISSITFNMKTMYLGSFDDKKDAAKARKKAEVKYGFHENHGRDRRVVK